MESTFPVAILAGGLATRLHPLTHAVPKALVEVAGEPFIAHQLRLLQSRGIERVVICAGYLGESIEERIGDGRPFGLQVEYVYDGPRLLGTGGAVRRAAPRLGPRFFVLYGDSYLPCDYRAAQRSFTRSGRLALMTVYRNEGHWDASNVELADGRIVAYSKKERNPRMRHIDYGLGVFDAGAFSDVAENEPCDLADVYRRLLERGELAALEVPQRFYEIGSFEGLEELSTLLGASALHKGTVPFSSNENRDSPPPIDSPVLGGATSQGGNLAVH